MAHPPLARSTTRGSYARTSSAARSPDVPQGRQAVDTPRPVKVAGLEQPSALAGAVSSFFPAIERLKQKLTVKDLAKVKRSNDEIMAGVQTKIRANPKEAEEARKSGDYSFFGSPEQAAHPIWIDGFMETSGRVMGYQDYPELKNAVANTDPLEDPESVAAAFLQGRTEDANAIWGSTYTQTLRDLIRPDIARVREERIEQKIVEGLTKNRFVIEQMLENGDVQVNPAWLMRTTDLALQGMPRTNPVVAKRVDEMVRDAVMESAAKGNVWAQNLIEMPDPRFSGTPMAFRYPFMAQDTLDRHLAARQKIHSLAQENSYNSILDLWSAATLASQPVSPLIVGIYQHGAQFGWNKRSRSTRDKLIAQHLKAGADESVFTDTMLGKLPKDANAVSKMFAADYRQGPDGYIGWFTRNGGDPEQAKEHLIKLMARYPSKAPAKEAASLILRNGGDGAEHVIDLIRRARAISQMPLENFLPLHDARGFALLETTAGSGENPASILKAYYAGGESDKDISTHLQRVAIETPPGEKRVTGKPFTTMGPGWVMSEVKGLHTAMTPELIGVDPEDPGWEKYFDNREEFANTDPRVIEALRLFDNHASYALAQSGRANTAENRAELVWIYAKGKFGVRRTPDGVDRMEVSYFAPLVAIPDEQGIAQQGPPTPATNDEFAVRVAASDPMAALGFLAGMRPDQNWGVESTSTTALSGRRILTYPGASGQPTQAIFTEGTRGEIPAEILEFPVYETRQERAAFRASAEYRRTGEFPAPGRHDIKALFGPLASVFQVQTNPETGGWTWEVPSRPGRGDARAYVLDETAGVRLEYDSRQQGWLMTEKPPPRDVAAAMAASALKVDKMSVETLKRAVSTINQDLAETITPAEEGQSEPIGTQMSRAALAELLQGQQKYQGSAEPFEDAQLYPLDAAGQDGIEDAAQDVLKAIHKEGDRKEMPPSQLDPELLNLVPASVGAEAMYKELQESRGSLGQPTGAERGALMDYNMRTYSGMVEKLIKDTNEGYLPYVYNPRNGSPWDPRNAKGWPPLIGHAFNLNRPDADAMLRLIGTTKKRVMNGETINKEQARVLFFLAASQDDAWLRKHFKDVQMESHRWVALLDLAYESRHDKNGISGPTLIGPIITSAVREGRFEDAAWEIMFNSDRSLRKAHQNGQRRRRIRGVEMLLGPDLAPAWLAEYSDLITDPEWPRNVNP